MQANVDVGRMGENIITNELLARGYLVTHLDKGTRGVSANADLMVGHPDLSKPLLIQVKACQSKTTDWIFLGSITEKMLTGEDRLYNNKSGFKADILASVVVVNPMIYRSFILPIAKAEQLVLTAFRRWHEHPTKVGKQRKAVPTAYIRVNPEKIRKRASVESRNIFDSLAVEFLPYENFYELKMFGSDLESPGT